MCIILRRLIIAFRSRIYLIDYSVAQDIGPRYQSLFFVSCLYVLLAPDQLTARMRVARVGDLLSLSGPFAPIPNVCLPHFWRHESRKVVFLIAQRYGKLFRQFPTLIAALQSPIPWSKIGRNLATTR